MEKKEKKITAEEIRKIELQKRIKIREKTHPEWLNRDLNAVYAKRKKILELVEKRVANKQKAMYLYKYNPVAFIQDWVITRNRKTGNVPFILFQRQIELIQFLYNLMVNERRGLVEKSRDMGATWVCCAFSVWFWLFYQNRTVMWMTNKKQMLDSKGDEVSIFQKMRVIITNLPPFLKPIGFDEKEHLCEKKLINPHMGNTISGATGISGVRGSRANIFFKDESAHYEKQKEIDTVCMDVSPTTVDISSVNGTNNLFYTKAMSSIDFMYNGGKPMDMSEHKTYRFVMDWRDHPEKTIEWYNGRREQAIASGNLAGHAQEVDRDYHSSVEGILIRPQWVTSSINAHEVLYELTEGKLDLTKDKKWFGGVDIADEGKDTCGFVARTGSIVRQVEEWGSEHNVKNSQKVIRFCRGKTGIIVQYDGNGIGAGFRGEIEDVKKKGEEGASIPFLGFLGQKSPFYPNDLLYKDYYSPKNIDFFANVKAQGWWVLKTRFYKTWLTIERLKNKEKSVSEILKDIKPEDLISISSDCCNRELLIKLKNEISQPTVKKDNKGKLLIEKVPDGASSPNLADSLMMSIHIKPKKMSYFLKSDEVFNYG